VNETRFLPDAESISFISDKFFFQLGQAQSESLRYNGAPGKHAACNDGRRLTRANSLPLFLKKGELP
jgi:hypothetical protein